MPFLKDPAHQIRMEYIGIGVVVTAIVAAAFLMGVKVGFSMGLDAAVGLI